MKTAGTSSKILPIWEEELAVRSFETDFRERWKPACFFQAIQETATHHAAHIGYPYETMIAQDMIWILSRVKIRFYEFPRLGDSIRVQTWPKGIGQRLFFMRDFHFTRSTDGAPLADATSAWLLIRPSARRMVPPAGFFGGPLPDNPGRSALDEPLEKIAPPCDMPERLTLRASYSAIDLMGHVNNARYIEWICDALPAGLFATTQLSSIQINYNNEIRPEEQLLVSAAEHTGEPGVWLVQGSNTTRPGQAFEACCTFK